MQNLKQKTEIKTEIIVQLELERLHYSTTQRHFRVSYFIYFIQYFFSFSYFYVCCSFLAVVSSCGSDFWNLYLAIQLSAVNLPHSSVLNSNSIQSVERELLFIFKFKRDRQLAGQHGTAALQERRQSQNQTSKIVAILKLILLL